MLIKLILLAVIMGLFIYFIKNRNTMKLRAGKKLLFVLFIACAVVAVADPDLLSRISRSIGVGRGADLLLYGLVLAFSFVTLNLYLKFKDYDEKVAKLTRELALTNARDSHAVASATKEHRN